MKLKRDHEHRGEQLQFALAAARATTTKLPAIGASDGSRIDKCEPTLRTSTIQTNELSAMLGKRAQNALAGAARVIRSELRSDVKFYDSPDALTLSDASYNVDKDAVSSEGGSDADRDEKPAPRSAQSILASSASATVIAQEVKLRSRGELREGGDAVERLELVLSHVQVADCLRFEFRRCLCRDGQLC